jgi:hypothetical protein
MPRFGKTMAVFGAVYSVFAVLQGFTSEGKIYWLIKPRARGVYGSYVNHNHYAGLMELLLPFAVVLAFSGSVRGAKRFLLGVCSDADGCLGISVSISGRDVRGYRGDGVPRSLLDA